MLPFALQQIVLTEAEPAVSSDDEMIQQWDPDDLSALDDLFRHMKVCL